jgi:Protein of unknown function (DUF3999)
MSFYHSKQRILIAGSRVTLAALCLFSGFAFGLNKEDFALEVPVRSLDASQANKPLLSLDVPLEVYRASKRSSLADIRVINAAAEAVPYALSKPLAIQEAGVSKVVALLPFYVDQSKLNSGSGEVSLTKTGDSVSLVISPIAAKQSSGRILSAFYADLKSEAPTESLQALQSITLKLGGAADATTDVNASVTIDSSDDLKTWRTLQRLVPVFRLSRGGQLLSNLTIDVAGVSNEVGRYLRITSDGGLEKLPMTEISVQMLGSVKPPSAHIINLTGVAAPSPAKNTFHFDAGTALPVSRFNLMFADINTIAPIKISARGMTTEPWELLKSETLYRMALGVGGQEGKNADVALAGGTKEYRYWQVEIDERAGEFGARIPGLRLIFVPSTVVFTARGAGPFSLLIGNAQVQSQALNLASLVPNDTSGKALELTKVSLDLAQSTRRAGLGEKVLDTSADDRKKWILWASLILGVGGLGVFATRLLKEPKAK